MSPKIEGYYTVKEAAKELGKSRATVQYHISQDNIKSIKIGSSWLIPASELDKLREIKPGPKPRKGS
jgi:excisionase family DNA binding protein